MAESDYFRFRQEVQVRIGKSRKTILLFTTRWRYYIINKVSELINNNV